MSALEKDYEVLERLGEGAFGKVYKAKHRKSEDFVAVKQIKLGAKSWDEACKSTELAALRQLRHPFIVRLRELLRDKWDGSLYYIFEYIDSDLCRLVRANPQGLEELQAATLARQLIAGLAYIHQYNFFHRDIKPENVLYETRREVVRIADFGEAKTLRSRPPFTDYVGTRWYRAPECLLRDRSYSAPVDVWASGLVFAELLGGKPIFMGTSSIDQLYKIFAVLGQPVLVQDWPEFPRLAEGCRFRVPQERGSGLQTMLPRSPPRATALVSEILSLNPRRRPLARKLLEHSYFSLLPSLDLERLETSRSGVAGLERSDSRNSLQSNPALPPVAGLDEFAGIREPPTPVDSGSVAASSHPPSTTAKARELEVDDLDLDAELDKILGGDSPMAKALQKSSATNATAAAGGNPEMLAKRLQASHSTESFSFAPDSRSPPPDFGPPASEGMQAPASASRGASPDTHGGLVDALLNDLADLGVGDDLGMGRGIGLTGSQQAVEPLNDAIEDASLLSALGGTSSSKLGSLVKQVPWTAEEAMQLRRVVKKVVRLGARDKDGIWMEVSKEMGGGRGPRECKLQYARDYKADKMRKAAMPVNSSASLAAA
mmetsp:Transcript_59868/g.106454  ORF Transcript_59868/g.106454 Transcript_59868/m.106454 type:complete len:602 (-) Transcript_59868:70-1875(-)